MNEDGPYSGGGLAQEQEDLRETLRGIMEGLNENGDGAREDLDGAGQAMAEAQENLQSNQLGAATEAQQEALNQMRESAQELARNLAAENGQAVPGDEQVNEDPLGRRIGGNNPVGRLLEGLPNQSDIQRAREILDELRRRSGQSNRPRLELDYIDRLLQRF